MSVNKSKNIKLQNQRFLQQNRHYDIFSLAHHQISNSVAKNFLNPDIKNKSFYSNLGHEYV